MKKTLLIILNFILLSTVTACGTTRNVIYECKSTCNCNSTQSETIKDEIVESTQNISDSTSTTNDVSDFATTEVTKVTELGIEAEKKLYFEAKNLYLTGKWNGKPTIMEGQNISLSKYNGALLINGHIVSNFQHTLDLPDSFDYDSVSSNLRYIPGEGMYLIKDKTLVKYSRGELISLGNSIDWIGFDTQHPEEYGCTIDDYVLYLPNSKSPDDYTYVLAYSPYLYYDNESDQLLLVTTDPISKLKHLYIFSDYNISETTYLGPILEFSVFGNQSDDTFYYLDTNKIGWEYTANGPQLLDEPETVNLFSDNF